MFRKRVPVACVLPRVAGVMPRVANLPIPNDFAVLALLVMAYGSVVGWFPQLCLDAEGLISRDYRCRAVNNAIVHVED